MTEPRKMAEQLVTELHTTLSDRLRAASLFGSAARGEWIDGISDVNVLVLLDDIDAPLLGRAAPVVNRWAAKNVRPLLMEVDEWRRATDVFTIELADMKDASSPLFGDDPAAAAVVQPSILRLQAERELRVKLLHLHAGMVLSAGDRKRLGELFVRALPSFTTYMRTALRLAKRPVPSGSRAVIDAACTLIAADPAAFLQVHDARAARSTLSVSLDQPLADDYNTAAEKLAAYVDAFGR